jgi:hypothetical protein
VPRRLNVRPGLEIARFLFALIAAGLLLDTGGVAVTTSTSPRLKPAALEPQELTAFMDGFMSSNLGRFHAPA